MKRSGTAILFIGLLSICAGLYFTYEHYSRQHANRAVLESVPECSSCTRRHQAYARIKKAREKKRLAPVAVPE